MSVTFNDSQKAAILHNGAPLLIVAGAGSGKTATLVGRVTRLIQSGVKPEQILMLTFTNKAAKNMVERSEKSLGDYQRPYAAPSSITAGTFHSIAYQLLHKFGTPAGFFRSQYVLGEYQTKRLWEKTYYAIPKELRLQIYGYRLGGTSELASWHSQYRTNQSDFADFLNAEPLAAQWENIEPGLLVSCFKQYQAYKQDLGGIDFDDILVLADKMLKEPQILKVIKPNFKHILVDEYQDTSLLQASMLKSLAGEGENLVVVGDPKQSIYHFLAARVTNITRFKDAYPLSVEINLLDNYRSDSYILDLANNILEGSSEVENLHLKSTRVEGSKPHIHKYGSERMEARGIIRDIKTGIEAGILPSEIAILSRISSLTFHVERELVEEGLSYVKVGGLKLMNKLNIRQFIAFLELALDKYNWLAWETILPMIPLIGKENSTKLLNDFRAVKEWDWANPPPVSLGSGKRWFSFQKFWEKIQKVEGLKELPIQEALEAAYDIFEEIYIPYWDSAPEEEKAGKTGMEEEDDVTFGESINQMDDRLNEIKAYIVEITYHRTEFLANFLDRFKLDDSINQIQEEEKITVSTIHSAKGLEWDMVIVAGLEEGTLPIGPRTYGEPRADTDTTLASTEITPWKRTPYIEEEKRLFYVACTRAKKVLHITHSAQRRNMGKKDSPFLKPFKPKGPIVGTIETAICKYTLEKMATEEEQQRMREKYVKTPITKEHDKNLSEE